MPDTQFVLVRREPTDEMLEAALDKRGERVVPYTAERESGVPVECDIDEATANYCNVAAKEGYATVHAAMLAASLPPTDEEIDGLCRLMWPDAPHWRPEHARNMSSHRFADREQMRAFVQALTGQKP